MEANWEALPAHWFRRVIQEVIAAAKLTVICGDWEMDWNGLSTAVAFISREIDAVGALSLSQFIPLAEFRESEGRGTRWSQSYPLEAFRSPSPQ